MSDNTDDMNDLVLLAMALDEAVSKVKELEAKLAKAVTERDEALNQLDSAIHSVEVLLKRVAKLKGQDNE